MATNPSSTVVRAWARLVKAQQLAQGAIESRLKAARLPPLAWYDALLELERPGTCGLRPFELERALLLSQCNLSRLIDRLENAGYAGRRVYEQDGRGQVVVITAAGKSIRRRMWAVYGPAIQGALGAHLTPHQAAVLDELLGAMVAKSTAHQGRRAPLVAEPAPLHVRPAAGSTNSPTAQRRRLRPASRRAARRPS